MYLKLEKIINGGQALGTLDDGRKALVWNGLPGEAVEFDITKKKSKFVEGIVTHVINPDIERIMPKEPDSYLSTSPWQMMTFVAEQHYKSQLIRESLELHHVDWTELIDVYSDGVEYGYRNKLEFSWFGDTDAISGVDTLDIAFFRRGSKGKITVEGSELAHPNINTLAREIRNLLRTKPITARNLKTLLIRCDQKGNCVWQLYIKDKIDQLITDDEATAFPAQGGEVIYSTHKSPASVITERLASFGDIVLTDTILDTPFRYATEGFFQVNIPVYEQALRDMRQWIGHDTVLDLYSGVGTIGLTIGGDNVTLVEINEHAVREMRQNITTLGKNATAVLAASEQALDHITSDKVIILDPPRAGLHADVVAKLIETAPPRIIYLSCNPVTQARDVALLLEKYTITHLKGYNFFPRTPHIESLIVLDKIR
jgi:23S rRNA (uracil1939-C5)-methyltransferase